MKLFELTQAELEALSVEEFEELEPTSKQLNNFEKHLFYDMECPYSESFENLWLEHSVPKEIKSFQDFVAELKSSKGSSIGVQWCETQHDLVNYILEDSYGNPTSFTGFKTHHYEILESYVDFKRGYEKIMQIFELDYDELGIKKPKKKDRVYFGISYTETQLGEIYNYKPLMEYKLTKKRIVVEEWESMSIF